MDFSGLQMVEWSPGKDHGLLFGLWHLMQTEGKAQHYCQISDHRQWTIQQWGEDCCLKHRQKRRRIFITFSKGYVAFMTQVDNYRPHRAEAHWCTFSAAGRRLIDIGVFSAKSIIEKMSLEVLYGFTPAHNTRAIEYLQRIGGTVCGMLPGGSYQAIGDQNHDSALIAFKRGFHENL